MEVVSHLRPRTLLSATTARIRRQRPPRYRPRAGLSVPIVTVLDRSGRVLVDEQRAVVRYAVQAGAGADIIFAAGTTGEWDKLDNSRRQLIARIAVDECRRLARNAPRVEVWVGVTAHTREETLANLEHALVIGADAAVIAPLSVRDLEDPVSLIAQDFAAVFERAARQLPVFLYDNADIAAAGQIPHLHTRDVKTLSQLAYVHGIKVTAGKSVLGNYTRAAAHFKRTGEFAIYPGSPYLIFDLFTPPAGLKSQLRAYWNRYLTQHALPHGVVAGAANVMPREWQRSWQLCRAGVAPMIERYERIMAEFRAANEFTRRGKPYRATIACLKAALADLGVCSSDAVAAGTPMLEEAERREFLRRLREVRRRAAATLEPEWLSEWSSRRSGLTGVRQDA